MLRSSITWECNFARNGLANRKFFISAKKIFWVHFFQLFPRIWNQPEIQHIFSTHMQKKNLKNVGVIDYIYEYSLELVECNFARPIEKSFKQTFFILLFGIFLLVNPIKLWKSLQPFVHSPHHQQLSFLKIFSHLVVKLQELQSFGGHIVRCISHWPRTFKFIINKQCCGSVLISMRIRIQHFSSNGDPVPVFWCLIFFDNKNCYLLVLALLVPIHPFPIGGSDLYYLIRTDNFFINKSKCQWQTKIGNFLVWKKSHILIHLGHIGSISIFNGLNSSELANVLFFPSIF